MGEDQQVPVLVEVDQDESEQRRSCQVKALFPVIGQQAVQLRLDVHGAGQVDVTPRRLKSAVEDLHRFGRLAVHESDSQVLVSGEQPGGGGAQRLAVHLPVQLD